MTVVVGGVTVVIGFEAEKTKIDSGESVLAVVSVGMGDSTGFFESFVLHLTSVDVEDESVTVNVKADMDSANVNGTSNWDHIL